MANLRDLLYNSSGITVNYPQEFLVYHTSVNSENNGGCCCLWTVPSGVTWVTFEMWGGGGGGAGACCCMQGWAGGSGGYALKTVCSASLAGCQYTICAGGTTTRSVNCIGCVGCRSYVNGYGLSNFCAAGGAHGDTKCFHYAGAYTCTPMWPHCCCSYGGDVVLHGINGSSVASQHCYMQGQQRAPTAPLTSSGPFYGPGGCINGGIQGCGFWFETPPFPGGGGLSAQAYSGNCWCGTNGAGGLVSVTYG